MGSPWLLVAITAAKDPILAELVREGDSRARVYPDRIAKGRLAQQEADYQQRIWAEIVDNVAEALGSGSLRVSGMTFGWQEKVDALEREVDYRSRLYPGWVEKGRLDQATADRQLDLVSAARDLYWRHMFTWSPPKGSAAAEYLDLLHAGPWDGLVLVDGATKDAIHAHPGRHQLDDLVMAHEQRVAGEASNQEELQL